jgi:hypothetical protein
VVEVGVREEHLVDARDTLAPQDRGNIPPRYVWPLHRPGVVQQDPPIRSPKYGSAVNAFDNRRDGRPQRGPQPGSVRQRRPLRSRGRLF